MEDSNAGAVGQEKLDWIINRLIEAERELPFDAFDAAQEHREEVTPLLIRMLEDAVRDYRQGLTVEDNGHFYATYLLADFRATEAWPAFSDAITLPEEGVSDLFGDAVTEDLAPFIACLVGDSSEPIHDLIANPKIDFYIRWAAIDATLYKSAMARHPRGDHQSVRRALGACDQERRGDHRCHCQSS